MTNLSSVLLKGVTLTRKITSTRSQIYHVGHIQTSKMYIAKQNVKTRVYCSYVV